MACVKAQYNSSYASLGHFIMTLVNLKSPIKLKFSFLILFSLKVEHDKIMKSVNFTPANR